MFKALAAQVVADLGAIQRLSSDHTIGRSALLPSLDIEEARQLVGELKAPAIFFSALSNDDSADLPTARRTLKMRLPRRRFDKWGREVLH
jgi:hypothetical protein